MILFSRLSKITQGMLIMSDSGKTHQFGQITDACKLCIKLDILDQRFYGNTTYSGSIGAGEAFVLGYWETGNLTGLVQLLLKNRHVLDSVDNALSRLAMPVQKFLHWLNRNTQKGSRQNIAAHYDIGNDLFKIMLDNSLMYSSAIFSRKDMSLHEAQLYRLDTICRKLDLKPEDHLLEIGTGWGGLSIHAARHYGCQITTTTISRQQFELACQRVAEEGLEEKITVLLEDYRNLQGQYDKLVSIEMIEAVGHKYYNTYFKKCSSLLKPDGMMLLQAITISDQNYESAKRSVDFIQRYIFPGSCIPSVTAMLKAITCSSDLRLYNLVDIGPHYARTLREWHKNVVTHIDKIKALGYSEEFLRLWEFYLAYCEGGFIERAISDVHMLLVKPGNRTEALY